MKEIQKKVTTITCRLNEYVKNGRGGGGRKGKINTKEKPKPVEMMK